MRKLNVKFVLALLGGLALVSAAVAVAHGLQGGNISSALLRRATQAEGQGHLAEAARCLQRYLEFVPDDADERAHLGRLLADPSLAATNRGRQRARYVLEQVLAREPERHDLRVLLVRLALDGGEPDQAAEHLRRLQKARPADLDVAGLTAEWQERQGQLEPAVRNYRRALKTGKVAYQVRLIHVLLALERRKPGTQAQEIAGLVQAARRQAPADTGVLLAAAEWEACRGDNEAARRHLEAAARAHPGDGRPYLALSGLDARAGRRAEAMAALRRGLAAVPPAVRPELLWALANLHLDGGDEAAARKRADEIRAATDPSPMLDFLEARCLVGRQRWPEAAALLERVRARVSSAPGLLLQVELLLARCHEQQGEAGQQQAACLRALALDPSCEEARTGAAAAAWALGRPDAAVAQYRQLLALRRDRPGQAAGHAEVARLLLASNARKDPRRWQEAEQELDAADREQPGSAAAALLRAELRLAQGRPADAEKVLREAAARQPKEVPLWDGLAVLAERRGDLAGACAVLDEAERRAGDGVPLRLARARFLMGRPPAEALPALARLEAGAGRFPAAEQLRLLHGLAEAHYRAGDVSGAARLWQALAARPEHARDLRLRLLLFDVAVAGGDEPAMARLVGELRSLDDADGAVWRYGEAVRLMWRAGRGDKDGLAQAEALLDQVAARRPEWAPALLARAQLEELRGRPGEAVARYRRALGGGAKEKRAVRRTVQLLASQERYGEAEQVLRDFGRQAPLSADLRRLAIALSLQTDDFARAEELVRQSGAVSADDYRDQLWLGQVLAAGGRRSAEAEKALRRAVELAGGVPETWVALVRYLAFTGRPDQARAEIEKARACLKGADAPLALAACWELAGDAAKAKAQYEIALRARPTDPGVLRAAAAFYLRAGDVPGAEPHLRRLLEGKSPATPDDQAWARRTLALALAGDPRRLPEALALVDLRLDARGDLADGLAPGAATGRDDDLARARVLAGQRRRPFRARAVSLLERAAAQQPLAADDQFLLARLYLALGDTDILWGKAREQLQELTAGRGRSPVYLAFYARALLSHGDPQEAERVLDRLEQVQKAAPAAGAVDAVELRAQALVRTGRGPQALALLDRHAHAAGAPPERQLLAAVIHAQLGDLRKAIDVCDGARPSCRPGAAATAALTALRVARQKEQAAAPPSGWREQAARVEGWLREAMRSQPEAVGPRLTLADLLELAGRGGEAEPLYREVLARDAKNRVALNNLAWLLARQAGKGEEALALIDRAVGAYGPEPELLDTRGVVYLALGKSGPAVTDLERAAADSASLSSYFHLVRAHHAARDRRAALAVLNQARAAGLSAERLHPAERDDYRRVVAELGQR